MEMDKIRFFWLELNRLKSNYIFLNISIYAKIMIIVFNKIKVATIWTSLKTGGYPLGI